jgi:hypothetical protein
MVYVISWRRISRVQSLAQEYLFPSTDMDEETNHTPHRLAYKEWFIIVMCYFLLNTTADTGACIRVLCVENYTESQEKNVLIHNKRVHNKRSCNTMNPLNRNIPAAVQCCQYLSLATKLTWKRPLLQADFCPILLHSAPSQIPRRWSSKLIYRPRIYQCATWSRLSHNSSRMMINLNNSGMMISKGNPKKCEKTWLQCHYLHHESLAS